MLNPIAMTVMNKTVRVGAKNLRKRGDTYLKIGNTFKVALAGQGWRGEKSFRVSSPIKFARTFGGAVKNGRTCVWQVLSRSSSGRKRRLWSTAGGGVGAGL